MPLVQTYHQRAAENAAIDYTFHVIVNDPTDHIIEKELPQLIEQGHRSLKVTHAPC